VQTVSNHIPLVYWADQEKGRFSYGELKTGPEVPYLEKEDGFQGLTKETTCKYNATENRHFDYASVYRPYDSTVLLSRVICIDST
jgi:hypothetical protein